MSGVLIVLSIIPILIAGYALFVALRTESYARIQVQLMQEQAKKSEEQERDERQWAERHERLASRLSRISPNMMLAAPDAKSHFCLYPDIFRDPQFRSKLETYIVDLNASRTEFRPHKATPHELRLQGLRDTVNTAEQLIDKYIKENPKVQLMYYLGVEKRV
jgi:hypothetical protein